MNLRRILRTGITASAVAHLSALALLLFFTEVHPFGSVTAEPITVDLVPATEVAPIREQQAPLPEPKAKPSIPEPSIPKPSEAFEQSSNAAAAPPPAASPPPAPPQQQAALSPPTPAASPADARPPPPRATNPAPAYLPPEPDLSIKYHVMLGLPPDLPAEPHGAKPGSDFDAPASKTADIDSSLVTEFRRHLRSCSKLPPSVAASDRIRIKLRVLMTPEGKLAAKPLLIEASASDKGPLLMQSAMAALEACQPYAMLPADPTANGRCSI